jgi:hypothetical protein
MTEEERKRLGETRRLIFQNVACGLPIEQVAATFEVSRERVLKDVIHVARKIREYRFQRRLPPVPSESIVEIQVHRRFLLASLANIGSRPLASDLIIPSLGVQTIKTVKDLKQASAEARIPLHEGKE